MLLEIEKIIVSDRIRKDFGDIQELADDIKKNSLLNPIVVMPIEDGKYQLIAGERRLQACKLLGYKGITVNTVSVKDAEQALEMEISENEIRKDFSKKERIDYARRLEKIEKVKAEQRRQITQNNNTAKDLADTQSFGELKGETNQIVANKLGIGSGETYRKEKYIVDNANEEILNAWDKGDISTNKAYISLMEEKKALENENQQLKNQPPKIVEKEVIPKDYYKYKHDAEDKQLEIERLIKEKELLLRKANLNDQNAKKYDELKNQIENLTQQKNDISSKIKASTELAGLSVRIENILKTELAPVKYSRAIYNMKDDEIVLENLTDIIHRVQEWVNEMNKYMPNNKIETIDVEVID